MEQAITTDLLNHVTLTLFSPQSLFKSVYPHHLPPLYFLLPNTSSGFLHPLIVSSYRLSSCSVSYSYTRQAPHLFRRSAGQRQHELHAASLVRLISRKQLSTLLGDMTSPRDKGSHLPFWKAGSGHYGDTLGKQSIGTSFSSEPLILSFLGQLRKKHGESLPIQIVYEDQERNDFNSLFHRLSDETSYMSKFSNVYPLATNVNFYKQCVPDGTCDIILSSHATHWLEKLDMQFKDTYLHYFASEEEQRRFNTEADRDWTKFLRLRARELKPGGLLIVLHLGICDNFQASSFVRDATPTSSRDSTLQEKNKLVEYTISGLGTTCLDLYLDFDSAWKQLREEGVISQKEYDDCNMACAIRTATQLTSPFMEDNSPVREAGLSLIHIDELVQPCVLKLLWLKKLLEEGVDDRDSFAQNMVTAHRVWSQSSVASSLSDMRSAEERAAILDKLYLTLMKRVAARDPRSYKSDAIIGRLVARKE
ncbi:hypothetical protein V1264_007242 [Littorina saxatilis]|uniref:Uncharacterized protein n=2 Tax=Littorina saxatilis TaxID=31220 RepID=A0AAN9AUH2_9CAEN